MEGPTIERERGRAPAEPAEERERHAAEAGLLGFLESDQLVVERQQPVPRARLSRRSSTALWALRVFGVVLSAMVIYTFATQLAG
jgi:hypothetical protein